MEFKEIVTGFAEQTGLGALTPDDEGTYWLKIDAYTIGFSEDAAARALVIHTPIAERTDENTVALAETLLELNFLYFATQGGTLALDREAGLYFYQRREALDTLDVVKFMALVEAFVNRAEELTGKIEDFVRTYVGAESVAEAKAAEERELGGLSSSFMQV